ncbi:MAG: hypothetical protein KDN22_21045 [Verrucomicrobiae bacterium]|nr:hypothetical protein [Verrucomicrobiae bacterium]
MIRESDQASLVAGAYALVSGQADFSSPGFYIYDKQFGSYWFLSLVIEVARGVLGLAVDDPFTVLTITNAGACLFFLSGIVAMLWNIRARGVICIAVISVLLGPVLLFSAPLASSNIISAGAVGWLVVLIRSHYVNTWVSGIILGLLGWLAVSCRVDAVLLIPAIVWCLSPRPTFRGFLCWRQGWILAASGFLAIVMGRSLTERASGSFYDFFFFPKIFAAYLTFGLGVGGLLLLLTFIWRMVREASFGKARRRVTYGIGVLVLLMPFSIYAPQFFTPRHLLTTAMGLLIVVSSSRGAALLITLASGQRRLACTMLLVSTLVPMVVGVRMLDATRPSVVLLDPTLFPTTDGLWPMGSYGSFLFKLRNAKECPFDHNQRVWNAVATVEFPSTEDGVVPIYRTPMSAYLGLGAVLQGKYPIISREKGFLEKNPFVICDERSLRRRLVYLSDVKAKDSGVAELAAFTKERISLESEWEAIIRCEAPSDFENVTDSEIEFRIELASVFGGDPYVVWSLDKDSVFHATGQDFGKKVIIASSEPFEMLVDGERTASQTMLDVPGEVAFEGYIIPRVIECQQAFHLVSSGQGKVFVAVSELPLFMSVNNL